MVEVARQVQPHASIFVGSEEVEDVDGWPYDRILADLAVNPAMTPAALGRAIVRRYTQFYTSVKRDPLHTQSAIDLTRRTLSELYLAEGLR
jgi:hypothetical protein